MRASPIRIAAFALVTTALTAATARSQTSGSSAAETVRVTGGATWMSLWDDETFLGRGALLSGGIVAPLGRHVTIEGEVAGGTHHRDAGYLASDGAPLVATGRLSYMFRAPEAGARPFASAGLSMLRSTGHLTLRSIVPDDRGLPVEGPSMRTDWSITKQALELGGGMSIRTGPRFFVRPEFRWTATGGASGPSTGIEPPLVLMRAGVTLEWRVRRVP